MREALARRLKRRPHAPVGIFPTPLQKMPRLSELFVRPVYFKRDDLAGLAVGGSKIRVLQHTAGDALERGADLFVAGGYVQSNHPMQVAAVGRSLGIPTEMVLDTTKGYEVQGNLLLTALMGVKVYYVRLGSYEAIRDECARLVARLQRRGRRARLLTLTPEIHVLNALAYAEGFLELARQLEEAGIGWADIFIGSGGPTYAGLVLGAAAWGHGLRVHGAPPRGIGAAAERVLDVARRAAGAVGLDIPLRLQDVALLGRGEGVYGFTYPAAMQAIRMVAKAEGVFLDPVYTGNAMAEMLAWLKEHPGDSPVVFFHTGGVPAVFAFDRELMGARHPRRGRARRAWRLGTPRVRRAAGGIRAREEVRS
jgi:1-aminocyclopropane-1-carboxylate deaminase/D-cysteine desulfhydrase-like pyridoxal-dependent ACC family enzyme